MHISVDRYKIMITIPWYEIYTYKQYLVSSGKFRTRTLIRSRRCPYERPLGDMLLSDPMVLQNSYTYRFSIINWAIYHSKWQQSLWDCVLGIKHGQCRTGSSLLSTGWLQNWLCQIWRFEFKFRIIRVSWSSIFSRRDSQRLSRYQYILRLHSLSAQFQIFIESSILSVWCMLAWLEYLPLWSPVPIDSDVKCNEA